MGITHCSIHGRSEIVETCVHIAEQVDSGKHPSGHRFNILGNVFLCQECFENMGLPSIAGLLDIPLPDHTEDEHMDVWEKVHGTLQVKGSRVFCLRCIEDRERQTSQ